MAGAVIKSLLKEAVQTFPEGQTIKGQAIESMLKKKGVKEEEIKFAELGIDPNKRYAKQELETLEASRKDVFEEVEVTEPQYDWVSLHDQTVNQTYKEKILTFSNPDAKAQNVPESIGADLDEALGYIADDDPDEALMMLSEIFGPNTATDMVNKMLEGATKDDILAELSTPTRYTSEHFPAQPNYLVHVRTFDDTIEGKSTRVLQEIQSDLHQQARKLNPRLEQINDLVSEGRMDEAIDSALDAGMHPGIDIEDWLAENIEGIPISPFEKTWTKKAIERELVSTINEGREQLAIPIVGAQVASKLHRSEGAQKFYKTQVVKTAEKLAKSIGAEFELKTISSGKSITMFSPRERGQLLEFFRRLTEGGVSQDRALTEMRDAFLQQGNPQAANIVDNVHQGLLTPTDAMKALSDAKMQDTITYAIIRPKAGSAPTFNLYTTPIAGASAVYVALKNGYTPEEITQDFTARGEDPDDIANALKEAQFIQNAVSQGYSEEDAIAYLKGQQPKIESVDDLSLAQVRDILATGQEQQLEGATNLLFPDYKKYKYDIPRDLVEGKIAQIQKMNAQSTFSALFGRAPDYTEIEPISEERAETLVALDLKAKERSYQNLTNLDLEMDASEFLATMQAIQPNMSSITTRTMGYFGSQEDAELAINAERAAKQRIIDIAKKSYGLDLLWKDDKADPSMGIVLDSGQWFAVVDGQEVPVNAGFWDSIKSEGFEIAGAIAGGVAGAKYTPGGYWGKLVGSIGGAAIGGAAGSQLDYLQNAIKVQQDLNAEVAAHRALTAGESSIIGDAIAYPVIKGLGYGWEGIVKAKNSVLSGNIGAAADELKKLLFLSDDEAKQIVTDLKAVADIPVKGKSAEELASMVMTQPGGEEIMRIVGAIDPKANRAVAKSIDTRAKDILDTAADLTDSNISKLLNEDLINYQADVKAFYESTKNAAAQSPKLANFSFDYDKLAIQPVLNMMEKQITDLPAAERFMRKAQVIAARSDSRTFTDLLELRKILNSFRFGRGTRKAADLKAFKNLMTQIDDTIKQGAKAVVEKPEQWLEDWAVANAEYAKMKSLESNVLAKVLSRKGINETQTVKSLTRYITSTDGTWDEVMSKLPPNARAKAEGAVVNALAEKFTAGSGEGMRAVNFPMLDDALSQITFTDPASREFAKAISGFAKVFKNDVPLSQHTGNIVIPKEQSYLTTDPVVRLKYEFASTMFNYVKRLMPTDKGRALNLMLKTADLLEQPLNARSAKELMKEVGDSVSISPKILQMQQQAARQAAEGKESAKIKLWGTGDKLSLKGSGKSAKEIQLHRIATAEDINRVAQATGIRVDSPNIDWALKQYGYLAKLVGSEKVEVFK